jgi:cytochrome P450
MSARPMTAVQELADQIIADRRQGQPLPAPDLLDLLIAGEDPQTGRRMTPDELRDNLLTFIVAGHETTALTLAWALYLMAFAPEVQERAAAEAAILRDRPAQVEDLPALPLIRAIVDEALRLYPPAAFLARTAQVPDRILGREVRPGDTVILPIYALHRHRKLWDNPDAFDPVRFLAGKPVERFAYLPFGDGPRICIGAAFALQEAVLILATLLARFRFAAVPGREPKPVMILTLRPQGGVWLTAVRR